MPDRPSAVPWWWFCERCLKPCAGIGKACESCDHRLLELCDECFEAHVAEHAAPATRAQTFPGIPETPDPEAAQEFAAAPKTETNGKPPKD